MHVSPAQHGPELSFCGGGFLHFCRPRACPFGTLRPPSILTEGIGASMSRARGEATMKYRTLSRSAFGALGLVVLATGAANAGGFAVREQSAYGQGSSFAGIAAGGALSSMFWNPATVTQFRGLTSETVLTGVLPHASHSFTSATDA